MTYHPYGDELSSTGASTLDRRYIGERTDSAEEMSYLNARYYRSGEGQFISQDPVFWEIGSTPDGVLALKNPQSQNSYSYAGDNPIVNKDPTGRFWWKEFYSDWKGYNITSLSWDNGLILKAGEVFGGRSAALAAIEANAGNIDAASKQTGMSPEMIKAIIYEEQSHQFPPLGGETVIENIAPGYITGGIGIMQVRSKTSGKKNTELLNPSTNIVAGAQILQKNSNNGSASNKDIASKYNAQGGGSHANRYGKRVDSYVSSKTYISTMSKLLSKLSSALSAYSATKNKKN
jgi:RHS repeat-associated protein